MGKILGIDLGTTNSCISVLDGTNPTVIHNQEGGRTTPSMVSWTADGDVVVGAASKRQMVTNPRRTVFGVKRLIGAKMTDPQVAELVSTMPYQIVAATNGDARVSIEGQLYSAQEISAHVLNKLRQVAEEYLGEAVTEAVITVPAYFDDVQRQATRDAGAIAGLTVRAILNEPTAAALAYGVGQKDQRVAVFDLGGGTFDISVLAIEGGVFQVLSTYGDTQLGGDDFDRHIIEFLASEFLSEHGIDLRKEPAALQRLKEAAERAKVELSSSMHTDINLPFLAVGPNGPMHMQRDMGRGELERICKDLLARLEQPCQEALKAARCTAADIDQVLLVGGMSRMPAVQEQVIRIFGKAPSKGVNPDEIVAMGAAIHSGILGGEIQEVTLLDVTPHNLGVRVAGDKMSVLIPANTSIPHSESKTFMTAADNQTFVAIEIYQGPNDAASKNRHLGRFTLGGLPEAAKGQVRVDVEFMVNADGIVEVAAKNRATGISTSMKVEMTSGLEQSEVERLAESFKGRRA
ncbi:MAG: molecular chaperone DnaK [Myxococcales bacterium]|nr:molecular chaperone DnaK [Myxococcales bacterium]